MYTKYKNEDEIEFSNFYPEQYRQTQSLAVNHNYLVEQFFDHDEIFSKIAEVVKLGDFTLGDAVDRFEKNFQNLQALSMLLGL